MRKNKLSEVFLCAVVEIENIGVRADVSRENTEEGELPDVRIKHGFEDECGCGTAGGRLDDGTVRRHARAFQRILADVDDAVHDFGNSDVFCHASGENWNEGSGLERIVQTRKNFRFGELFSGEIAFHERFIGFGDGVEECFFAAGGVFFQVVRYLIGSAEHADDAFEFRAFPDGKGHGNADVFAVCLLKLSDNMKEVGVVAVEAVDEGKFRNIEALAEFECARRSDFKSVCAVHDDERRAACAVCGDDLADEGSVSWGVGEEEAEAVPFAAHVCGVDAGVLFLLVRGEV